jgi:hypothetical protein
MVYLIPMSTVGLTFVNRGVKTGSA